MTTISACDEEIDEPTLVTMRSLRDRSEKHLANARALMPPYGSIAIGAGEFDEWIIGECLAVLLREMSETLSPIRAAKEAKIFARFATKKHNQKRPRDINWQRWEGHADAAIDSAKAELERTHPF